MKLKNFVFLFLIIAFVLGGLIYWREYATRDQVSLIHVLIWQIGVWAPWILGFILLRKMHRNLVNTKIGLAKLTLIGVVLVGLHFGWFFLLSSTASPYLNLPGSRFGVYRYFFVFWTLIDLALLWFMVDKLNTSQEQTEKIPLLLELTRGGNKFFCKPSDIQWLVSENYYTKLATNQGIFMMRKPLKTYLEILPMHTFLKIHRSTIINMDYVVELARGSGSTLEVIMQDGTRRRVSKSFIKEVTQLFKERVY